MLESQIQKKILDYLRGRSDVGFVVKLNDSFTAGLPDIHFIWQGRACYFEVKRKGEYATPLQQAMLRQIHKAGGLIAVVRSMEDVNDFFYQNRLIFT